MEQHLSAQIAGLPAQTSSGGSIVRGQRDPLASHKIYMDMEKLSGDEEYHGGMDWFKALVNFTEIALPGSGSILKEVLDSDTPITLDAINKMRDPLLASNLSREIHGLLCVKKHTHVLNTQGCMWSTLRCTAVSNPCAKSR